VDADTAAATAAESWHASFNDGTGADSKAINVYTLVQESGTWLIEADRRVAAPAATTPARRRASTPPPAGRATSPMVARPRIRA
jgi:hypothetical protein